MDFDPPVVRIDADGYSFFISMSSFLDLFWFIILIKNDRHIILLPISYYLALVSHI